VPASLKVPATAMYPRLTTVLGSGAVMLYQRDTGRDITVVASSTPAIVLGPRLITDPASGGVSPAEARALLARAVELARPEHVAFAGLPFGDATRLVASVARLFGSTTLRAAAENFIEDDEVQQAHDDTVKAALSLKLRTRLEQALASVPPAALDVTAYRAACHRTADRAALLLDGDPATIAKLCQARGEGTAHLISAVSHPGWMPLRAKLGLGVR